jgi:hypothetical protein
MWFLVHLFQHILILGVQLGGLSFDGFQNAEHIYYLLISNYYQTYLSNVSL